MDAEPGEGQETAAPQPTAAMLQAYVDANAGKFTDAAIVAELTRAGYAEADVRAALAEAARSAVAPPRGRAVATILALYGLTFALLSIGMLANTYRPDRSYAPDAFGGIMVLAFSLGFALLLSLAWVGNRRAAAFVFAIFLGIWGVGTLADGSIAGVIVLGVAIALVVWVLRRGPAPTQRSTTTLAALLSVPVILLVIVAGLCLATGLPIPGTV